MQIQGQDSAVLPVNERSDCALVGNKDVAGSEVGVPQYWSQKARITLVVLNVLILARTSANYQGGQKVAAFRD